MNDWAVPSATASLLTELRDAIGSRKRTKMISPEDTIYSWNAVKGLERHAIKEHSERD